MFWQTKEEMDSFTAHIVKNRLLDVSMNGMNTLTRPLPSESQV